jgi:hypothetical protein
VRLLDARGGEAKERRMRYQPELVEGLDGIDVDVVLTSVPHYQLGELLPLLANSVPAAELLFFGNLWTSFEPVDPQLRGRYMWGAFRWRGTALRRACSRRRCCQLCSLGSCQVSIGPDWSR